MGSYANLWVSDSPSPVDEARVTEEIFAKWDVPLGWLALFEPQDFGLEGVDEDGEFYHILYSSKLIDRAIKKLSERSELISQVGGRSWAQGCEQFVKFLAPHNSGFVHVGYGGLMDDEFPAQDQRELYIDRLRNLRDPVLVQKKSLFGKPKTNLAKHWRLLVPSDFKLGVALRCSSWFGSPRDGQEDWA